MISQTVYLHYLSSLMEGNKAACADIVVDLLEKNVDIKDIYVDLFQKSMYRIGHLWENSRASISTEHIATKITESMMNLVYPKIRAVKKNGKRVIITCVDKEFHELGARMISDYLELKGWDSVFLGANTPRNEIIELIEEKTPDLVGISNNLYINVGRLLKLIDELRAKTDIPLMVGGQALHAQDLQPLNKYGDVTYISSMDELDIYLKRKF